jgi:hypothetical protein
MKRQYLWGSALAIGTLSSMSALATSIEDLNAIVNGGKCPWSAIKAEVSDIGRCSKNYTDQLTYTACVAQLHDEVEAVKRYNKFLDDKKCRVRKPLDDDNRQSRVRAVPPKAVPSTNTAASSKSSEDNSAGSLNQQELNRASTGYGYASPSTSYGYGADHLTAQECYAMLDPMYQGLGAFLCGGPNGGSRSMVEGHNRMAQEERARQVYEADLRYQQQQQQYQEQQNNAAAWNFFNSFASGLIGGFGAAHSAPTYHAPTRSYVPLPSYNRGGGNLNCGTGYGAACHE